uniref:Conotoxin Superfamily SF15 n=1 Tax=Conus episcopatus TaxID=88764 RepID=A0A0K2S737_CONEP|nr:Conotoxin Superfamily SF15 [Conus episcopatus]
MGFSCVFILYFKLPLIAVPLDGDQHADQPAERLQGDILSEKHPLFMPVKRCCDEDECNSSCWPCCWG